MPEAKTVTPAYVPFKTFVAALDSFKSFLPDRIDPTMWPSYSGGIKSQLMGALKFLGLIYDSGIPTDLLKELVHAEAQQRPVVFRKALSNGYTSLMQLDLTKATPGSFDAEMRKFGQEGDTHRKAASFFLQAAKYAGVPLSPLLTKKGSLSGSRRKRPGGTKAKVAPLAGLEMNGAVDRSYVPANGGSTREIVLSGGGRMFLRTDTDLFKMNSEDRKFVMGVLEKLEEYEASHPVEDQDEEEDESQMH